MSAGALVVTLGDDMSPTAIEELKHAILLWRGVRDVRWQDNAHLRARVAAREAAVKDARVVIGFAFGTWDGYQQTATEFAATTQMSEWLEKYRELAAALSAQDQPADAGNYNK